jgi:hypothetical protein
VLPHYPIGAWDESVIPWDKAAGTWKDSARNEGLRQPGTPSPGEGRCGHPRPRRLHRLAPRWGRCLHDLGQRALRDRPGQADC